MRRKKVAKKAVKAKKIKKIQVKKQVKMNMADKMEKQFKEFPKQLIAHCRKDLSSVKQQQSKLSQELKKASALSKTMTQKCNLLTKAKPTASVKKQLVAAKKSYKKANDTVTTLTAKVQQLKLQIASLIEKQNKYSALNKEISNFEQNWKPAESKAKPTKKVKKKSSKRIENETPEQAENEAEETHHEEQANEADAVETTQERAETES